MQHLPVARLFKSIRSGTLLPIFAAILLISEELDELISLSDRIYVIYEGEIMGEVHDGDIDKIGQMMMGSQLEQIETEGVA